jgi:hypothetical protein
MARIRSIKPEFNGSASVNRMSESAQLFMVKLLTECDDYGRIRWLPKKIAGNLYPRRDDVDAARINELVAELEREEIFFRYEVDGEQYGCFPRWSDHQRIDRPSRSDIPPPLSVPDSCKPRATLASDTEDTREEISVGKGTREQGKRKGNKGEGEDAGASDPSPADPTPSDFMQAWNESVPFSPIRTMSEKRKEALRVRRNEPDWQRDWRVALGKIRGSPFLRGESSGGWKADVDWFLKPDSVTKILEGKYDGSASTNGRTSRPLSGVEAPAGKYEKIKLFGATEDAAKDHPA